MSDPEDNDMEKMTRKGQTGTKDTAQLVQCYQLCSGKIFDQDEEVSVHIGWKVIRGVRLDDTEREEPMNLGIPGNWQDGANLASVLETKLRRMPYRIRRIWNVQLNMIKDIKEISDKELVMLRPSAKLRSRRT